MKFHRYSGSTKKIPHKKAKEEMIRLRNEIAARTEDKYYSLFNSMNEGFVICEIIYDKQNKPIDWRFLEANPALEKQVNLKREKIVGKLRSEVFPVMDTKLFEKYTQVVQTKQSFEFEEYSKEVGKWLLIRAIPLGQEQFAVLFEDIGKRKKTEEALQKSKKMLSEELEYTKLLQQISNHIIEENNIQKLYDEILQSAMKIMHSEFASIQLYIPEKEQLYLLAYKGFPPKSAEFWKYVNADSSSSCARSMITGERTIVGDIDHCPFEIAKGDYDSYRLSGIASVQSTPLISRAGNHVGMMSTHWKKPHQPSEHQLYLFDIVARQAADLIERKNAEEALHKAAKQKDEFVSIVSHELKTPVTSLKVYAQHLEHKFSKTKDTESAQLLTKMVGQIDKLTILISDLLDTAKIESGKLAFREQTFSFDILLAEIVDEVQRTSVSHKIIYNGLTEQKIYADRDRIGQVITNLLTNAIKYSPQAVDVIVSAKALKGNIIVRVKDFGIGITKNKQQKIFERFYREEGEDQSTFPGLGIGLYVAAEIIKRYDGKIGVKNGRGKGSTFYFSLPITRAEN